LLSTVFPLARRQAAGLPRRSRREGRIGFFGIGVVQRVQWLIRERVDQRSGGILFVFLSLLLALSPLPHAPCSFTRVRSRPFFAAILGVFAIVEKLLVRGKLLFLLRLSDVACLTRLLLLLLLGES
jgi:hypothetical protein